MEEDIQNHSPTVMFRVGHPVDAATAIQFLLVQNRQQTHD